jgi:hypothetical protein
VGFLPGGRVRARYTSNYLTLYGANSIIGRSVIIHQDAANTTRIAGGTIVQKLGRKVTRTVLKATFTNQPVVGTVTFSQREWGRGWGLNAPCLARG